MISNIENIIVVLTMSIASIFFFSKKIRYSKVWQATVTPLASIIGSGFLISAPLIVLATGKWAGLAMLTIVIIAYLLGSAIRFNIVELEPLLIKNKNSCISVIFEKISRPILGIAYIISVSFYLKLLSAFAFRGFGIENYLLENLLTTIILVFIGLFGWFKGLHILEIFEEYAVNIKLIIIISMLISFLFFNIDSFFEGTWNIVNNSNINFFESFRKLLGFLIIVQGFETSRYIGEE